MSFRNQKCKKCGKPFHNCSSCDFWWEEWRKYYCSKDCAIEDRFDVSDCWYDEDN
jgi:hypothetical protein